MSKFVQFFLSSFVLLNSAMLIAYDSGSSGGDGVLNVTSNISIPLPPDGVLNFSSVSVVAGATLTFGKNANNTPVYLLVTGDVDIQGNINLDGKNNGFQPGQGGPGGFDGGEGAKRRVAGLDRGQDGFGPGGGGGSRVCNTCDGSGGSFATTGDSGGNGSISGSTYGTADLLHMIGGSGGGGAQAHNSTGNVFQAGGGGGGAILIAASGNITIDGTISANGGTKTICQSCAGSGSGGAIKLIATRIAGNGSIFAQGGGPLNQTGGNGRIRLEAEEFDFNGTSAPLFTYSTPRPVFYANIPSIRISAIAGVSAPLVPSGHRDVVLPGVTSNPVTVEFETVDVPLGTRITLEVTPESGSASTVTSTDVTGSLNLGFANASVNLPNGNSRLEARTTFAVSVSNSSSSTSGLFPNNFTRYAQGQPVHQIRVDVNEEGQSTTTFITKSGAEFTWPSITTAIN